MTSQSLLKINQIASSINHRVSKISDDSTMNWPKNCFCDYGLTILTNVRQVLMENEKEGFPITALREIRILQLLRHENIVNLVFC
jgi:hypothetical protein